MIRCPRCGAKNYAIDIWCTKCQHNLEWEPPRARRRAGFSRVVPPLAAAAGIALAMTSPVAAWHAGSLQLSFRALPNTGAASVLATPAEASQRVAATAAPTTAASPSTPIPEATTTPDALPTPGGGTPAILAAPPVYAVMPAPTPETVADPTSTVEAFYRAVSGHQFVAAASLWSPAMKSAYPPAVYIDQRFAATQRINVAGVRVLSNQAGTALIYVDLLELIGGQQRKWVGTWQLIQDQSGWLLNSPNLAGA